MFKSGAYFWMCLKYAKNGVSNINQDLPDWNMHYYQYRSK
jgi:hypothetical protein